MKAMKKALALGLALAMVVTAVPVTSAQAASTAKLSASTVSVAAGTAKKQTKSVKVTTPSTWKSVKVKASSSDKKIATVKVSGKTVKVTAVKKGSAKVTVKVSAKKSGKTVKKTLTAKVKVINAGLKFVNPATEVVVGESVSLAAKQSPKAAVVTYKSSDDTIATVDADGKVTAVKAGKVTITATSDYLTKEVTTDVTVKNVLLQSVKQTKADTLEATITGDTKTIKEADITVTNTTTNVVYPVKKVSVDSKDATKVTLTVFSGLTDGKEYNVTLDGVTKSFVATDGTVADVTVDKTTVPYATETTIKLVATDAQGIVLTEADYGTQDASKYDFSITTNNGYVNGSKLYLNKVGDTATAEVTYKTGKYGEDGKPVGNIGPKKITITAVEQAAINNYDVRIGKTADGKYDKAKDTKTIAVGEATNNVAYFMIKDADNKEVSNYYDYTVESSDTGVLMIQSGSSLGTTKSVVLVPVKAGTSYLLIKKNNAIVYSIPITVVAERAVATMTVDKTSASVSNAIDKPVKVTASFKDQYSDDIAVDGGVKVTCLSTTAKDKKPADVTEGNGYFSAVDYTNKSKPFVSFKSKDITEGTYVYKIAYEKDGKEVCARTVTINVQKPGDAGKSTVSFALNIDQTEVDAIVDKNNLGSRNITISVAELLNNVVAVDALSKDDKLDDSSVDGKKTTVKEISYKVVNKDGKTVYETDKSSDPEFSQNGTDTLTVSVVSSGAIAAQLASGTYNVTATIKTLAAGKTDPKDYVTKTITGSFTVKNTTPSGTISLEKESVAVGDAKAMVAAAVKYVYGEDTYGVDGKELQVLSVEGTTNSDNITNGKINADSDDTALDSGDILNVTKIVIKVPVTDTIAIKQEVNVAFKITATAK